MRSAESGTWQRTSPLAVLFFLGHLIQSIGRNAIQSFAPLAAFLYAYEGDIKSKLIFAATATSVVLIVSSVLRYWFFRFSIDDDRIRIREGVFKKKQIDIKFDRIQGINTEQNFVYRLFGLATVKFDTAGASGNEGDLPAVSVDLARMLQSRLGQQLETTEADTPANEKSNLLHLESADVVRIGLADPRALVLLALLGPLFEQLGEKAKRVVTNYLENAAESLAGFGIASGAAVGVSLLLAVVLTLIAISVTAAFLRYYNFQLSLNGDRVQSVGGLLTRHEKSMQIDKAQVLLVQQGIVMRLFKRARLLVRQASSDSKKRTRKIFEVPIAELRFAERFRQILFGSESINLTVHPNDTRFAGISPLYLRSRVLLLALAPALIATVVALVNVGFYALLFLLWIPFATTLVYRAWKGYGYLHDDQGFVRRSGVLGWRVDAFLFRKVQRVTVSQSIFQRRKGVATLKIYLASGRLRLPYMDHANACRLRDYMLFKVESSKRAWH